jgi:hypothetical protein
VEPRSGRFTSRRWFGRIVTNRCRLWLSACGSYRPAASGIRRKGCTRKSTPTLQFCAISQHGLLCRASHRILGAIHSTPNRPPAALQWRSRRSLRKKLVPRELRICRSPGSAERALLVGEIAGTTDMRRSPPSRRGCGDRQRWSWRTAASRRSCRRASSPRIAQPSSGHGLGLLAVGPIDSVPGYPCPGGGF